MSIGLADVLVAVYSLIFGVLIGYWVPVASGSPTSTAVTFAVAGAIVMGYVIGREWGSRDGASDA